LGTIPCGCQIFGCPIGYLGNRKGCPYIYIFCNWDDLKILIKFFNLISTLGQSLAVAQFLVAQLDFWATMKFASTYLFFCNWDDLKILIKFFNLISTLGQSLAAAKFLVARLDIWATVKFAPTYFFLQLG